VERTRSPADHPLRGGLTEIEALRGARVVETAADFNLEQELQVQMLVARSQWSFVRENRNVSVSTLGSGSAARLNKRGAPGCRLSSRNRAERIAYQSGTEANIGKLAQLSVSRIREACMAC
jgi:hypothetical protein